MFVSRRNLKKIMIKVYELVAHKSLKSIWAGSRIFDGGRWGGGGGGCEPFSLIDANKPLNEEEKHEKGAESSDK